MWVGRPLPRFEDPRLLRGQGTFTDDFVLPGQRYAAFVRSPHAHALVRDIAADGVPAGVVVLIGADYLDDGHHGIHHGPVPADAIDYTRPAFGTAIAEPHMPLATGRVRYVGEAVAVVIAETQAAARDAADLISVDYEPLPAVVDVLDAVAPGAMSVWPSAVGNVGVEAVFGDHELTERALASADLVVEHESRSQRIANAQLEPRSAIASYDAREGTYTMIAGSQGVLRQRSTLAAALGVPVERVRLICPDVGGGFGPRTSLYPEQVVLAWAARRIGRPVRWTSTRTEAFLTDFQGRDSLARARLGLDASGRIRALSVDFAFNVGAQTVSYVPPSNAARILTSVYDIPAACARVRGVFSHTVPTGPYRGAGRPEAIHALERLLDLAATELGMDRIELRRRNIIRSLPYTTALGLTYDSGSFAANMDVALARSDWAGVAARKAEARARGKRVGIGLANYVEAPVGAPHERVAIRVLPQGVVELTVGTQSTGQGHATVFAQVIADELGVDPGGVRLIGGDSDVVASGGGTHSDRSMRLVGTLIVEAAGHIRARCAELRRPLFEAADIVDLVAEASFTGRLPAHPTGTAVCEVEIDPETGACAITRYTTVDDVGQPVNPLIVEGQTHGGIVQGLGQALSEQVVFNPETGQPESTTFADYALPRASSLPNFSITLAEDPLGTNPLRIKGGGESGITPALACVENAIADAVAPTPPRQLAMPFTSNRLWHALHHP
ncbi:MAG TPA: xanthine dehydrogenase family protein molybdopterin-binding subunit [Chloroflexota bacterium]